VAETLIVPGELPVKVTEQVAELPLPPSVQLVLAGATPAPLAVRFTIPVGVLDVPTEVSLTVTAQLAPAPTAAGPAQLTAVEVARLFTVIEALAGPLPLWVVSAT